MSNTTTVRAEYMGAKFEARCIARVFTHAVATLDPDTNTWVIGSPTTRRENAEAFIRTAENRRRKTRRAPLPMVVVELTRAE
jgi:hypothetical protein